jgi:hypothetical protein
MDQVTSESDQLNKFEIGSVSPIGQRSNSRAATS